VAAAFAMEAFLRVAVRVGPTNERESRSEPSLCSGVGGTDGGGPGANSDANENAGLGVAENEGVDATEGAELCSSLALDMSVRNSDGEYSCSCCEAEV